MRRLCKLATCWLLPILSFREHETLSQRWALTCYRSALAAYPMYLPSRLQVSLVSSCDSLWRITKGRAPNRAASQVHARISKTAGSRVQCVHNSSKMKLNSLPPPGEIIVSRTTLVYGLMFLTIVSALRVDHGWALFNSLRLLNMIIPGADVPAEKIPGLQNTCLS